MTETEPDCRQIQTWRSKIQVAKSKSWEGGKTNRGADFQPGKGGKEGEKGVELAAERSRASDPVYPADAG